MTAMSVSFFLNFLWNMTLVNLGCHRIMAANELDAGSSYTLKTVFIINCNVLGIFPTAQMSLLVDFDLAGLFTKMKLTR